MSPGRLVEHLKWSPDSSSAKVPGDAIVLPFAGRDDASSLESILHAQAPELSPSVLAFDSSRRPGGKDLLEDTLYGALCVAALQRKVSFIGGSPDLQTWGRERWFPVSGRFHAERDRAIQDAWGCRIRRDVPPPLGPGPQGLDKGPSAF